MKKSHLNILLSSGLGMTEITVNPAQFSGSSHSDFPVLVDLSDMSEKFWGKVTNGGGDIRCYADKAKSTPLAREVVSCYTGSGTGEMWVEIPSFTSSTTFYVAVDGVSSEPSAGSPYGRNAVWSDYEAVWHLESALDSTGNGNDLGGNGGVSMGGITGQVGKGTQFDGSDDHLESASSPNLFSNKRTLQTWINNNTTQDANIFSVGGGNTGEEFNWQTNELSGGDFVQNLGVDGGNRFWTVPINDGVNHLLHLILDGDNTSDLIAYTDGQLDTPSGTASRTIQTTGSNNHFIGYDPSTNRRMDGMLDEFRIRLSVLSSDWIETEYNNMNSPSTFWIIE